MVTSLRNENAALKTKCDEVNTEFLSLTTDNWTFWTQLAENKAQVEALE